MLHHLLGLSWGGGGLALDKKRDDVRCTLREDRRSPCSVRTGYMVISLRCLWGISLPPPFLIILSSSTFTYFVFSLLSRPPFSSPPSPFHFLFWTVSIIDKIEWPIKRNTQTELKRYRHWERERAVCGHYTIYPKVLHHSMYWGCSEIDSWHEPSKAYAASCYCRREEVLLL